jgi:hypothetical protein
MGNGVLDEAQMSPGELGSEQSLLMALSCCSKTVVVDSTVLSDSVDDCTSSRQIWSRFYKISFGQNLIRVKKCIK